MLPGFKSTRQLVGVPYDLHVSKLVSKEHVSLRTGESKLNEERVDCTSLFNERCVLIHTGKSRLARCGRGVYD